VEPLETRRLLASMLWTGEGDGTSWSKSANWVEAGTDPAVHRVPAVDDDISIGSGANSNSRRTEKASAAWGELQLAVLAVRKPIIRLPFLE
jgi:hypothetical protein